MDILGIGGWELVTILVIMLVVAGPKRMIAWSYTLGKYVAVLRDMWAEAAKTLQQEFDQAGVDVKIPKELPTRGAINRELGRVMTNVSKPLIDPLNDVRDELRDATGAGAPTTVEKVAAGSASADGKLVTPRPANGMRPAMPRPQPPTPAALPPDDNDLGTWSS